MTDSSFEKDMDDGSGGKPPSDGRRGQGEGGRAGERINPLTGRPYDRRRPGQDRAMGSDDWHDATSGKQQGGDGGGTDREAASGVPALRSRQQPAQSRQYVPDVFSPASAYGEPPVDEERLDLRKYLWLLFKHRWLFAGSVGVCLVLGLLATFLTTPIYRASATLQINREVAKVVDFDGSQPEATGDVEFYQTQYELLKSRSLADRVVAKLALHDDASFQGADAPSPWVKLKGMFFFGGMSESASADVAERQREAASRVLAALNVEPVRSSSIVKLSFDSPDPTVAAGITNAIVDNFIAENLDRRYQSTAYARQFLEERLQQLKVKLAESEKELVTYAEKQQIISTGGEQSLTTTNLATANDALSQATNERLKKEQLWQQIQVTDGLALPQIMQSKAIETMRAKQVELAAEYEDKLSFFKPAFPEMKQIKAQIDELNRQIAAEVALIKESAKAEYETALNEERSLIALVDELKAEVTEFRNRNIQYNILQREVDTNRSLYDGLLQRYKEVGIAGGVGTNNISVVDRAQVPTSPYSPSLPVNLMVALTLGLMLGGAAAFAKEHLDDTFKSPEDVEEKLGLPLLGIIPLVNEIKDTAHILDEPHSAVAEAYRSLRTALQFSTTGGVPRSLLITSARASEGKSTTAVTLARNFAQLGMRVLLIDADLRKPSLHRYLAIDESVGLTNFLAGTMMPPQAFQKTEVPGLTVMTSGPLPPDPAELLAGPKMLSLLTIAAQKYDMVIIDGPPVAGLADAPLLASLAVGTLLIIDANGTRQGAAKAALKRLDFARAQMVGAVINKLDLTTSGYSYGYGYGYGDESYYGRGAPAQLSHRQEQ